MKSIIYLLLLCTVLVASSCASTKTTSTDSTIESAKENGARDGSSYAKAIIVNSIREEYEWVREHHPGGQLKMQSLQFKAKKPYDVLTFIMPGGEERDFYFDISRFYGKF